MRQNTPDIASSIELCNVPAPEIGAIGLNLTPDSGASFFVPMHDF